MGRRDGAGKTSAAGFEKVYLGRPRAVEGVVQFQVSQAEVIVGLGLGQDLLQGSGLSVPSRPGPGHLGRLVPDGGNGVGMGFHLLAGPVLGELDSIGRVAGDLDFPADGRSLLLLHRDGRPVSQQNARGDRFQVEVGLDLDPSAAKGIDVTAVSLGAPGQAGIGRKTIGQIDLSNSSRLQDRELISVGADVGGLDVVAYGFADVHEGELKSVGAGFGRHRAGFPASTPGVAEKQLDRFRLEALEPGRDGLIRPLADAGVAGRHLDAIEPGRLGPPLIGIELQSRELEKVGTMELQQDKQQHQTGTDQGRLQGFLAVENLRRLDETALMGRITQQERQEGVALGITVLPGVQLDGCDQAILQLGVVFLDGAGDLKIADSPSQGAHHQPGQRKPDYEQGGPAGQQEGLPAIVPIVDADHGDSHHHQGEPQPPGKAPDRSDPLETPACPPDGGLQALPFRSHG